jgi:hypothetical protein
MDEKPKRKRGENPIEVHFYTALTVEECTERLERGPSHTLDYRLSVRTDGERFKVEVLGDTGTTPGSMTVLAEMDGNLQPWTMRKGTSATRVAAETKNKVTLLNPSLAVYLMIIWQLVVIVLMISEEVDDLEFFFVYGVLVGGLVSTLAWLYGVYMTDKISCQIPDLDQWLMDQIYEPPGVSEEE